jgi:hypothetical protein
MERELVVVSFRGSRSATNIVNALLTAIYPSRTIDLCNGCMASQSFFNAYTPVRGKIIAMVNATLEQHPHFRVLTTGHSLGGALSHFAGLEFRNQGRTVDLVSDRSRSEKYA